MHRIFNEPEDKCFYKRLTIDYTRSLGKLLTESDIIKLKESSPSFDNEFCCRFGAIKIGLSFPRLDIKRATKHDYSLDYIPGTSSIMGIDVGWGSSATAITVCSLIDGRIILWS
jgi:hypothetical protein